MRRNGRRRVIKGMRKGKIHQEKTDKTADMKANRGVKDRD